MADYKIELGVKLDTSDLRTQISNIDDKHKVKLGVDLKVNDIRDRIKQYNANSNNAKVKLGVKLDIDDLKKQIKNLGDINTNKNALKLNTESLENSFRDVANSIKEIKNSLGTLDSESGMKSLLSSVNQIGNALEKASNQFEGLNAELSALSNKDFNINLGVNMGNQKLSTVGYGRAARKQVIPQLEEQIKYLENLHGGQQIAVSKLAQHKDIGFDIFTDFADFNSDAAIRKMEAMERYINSLKKLANIDNVDLSSFDDKFSKSASEMINDITGVENAVDKAEDTMQRFKNLFSNNINADALTKQLDSIVIDLGEIKTALQSLSSGISLDGAIQSFDKLSNTIELLIKNCANMKIAINDSVGNIGGSTGQSSGSLKGIENDLKQVTVTADNTADAIDSMRNAMSSMKFDTSSIDIATKDLEEMNIVIKEVSAKTKNGNFDIAVKGINDVGEAVEIVKRFNAETNNFDIISKKISKPFDEGVQAAKRFKKEAETVKNIKLDFEVGKYDDGLSRMETNYNKLSNINVELEESVKRVRKAYSDLELVYNSTSDEVADKEKLIQAENEYAAALEKTNNLIRIQAREEKFNIEADKLDDDIKLFQSNIDSWLAKNSAATAKFGDKLIELKARAENCDRVELNHLIKEFKMLDNEADKAGLKMLSLGDRIKTKFKEYSAYFSVAEAFMYVTQGLKDMFDQVVAIDTAMTELKKVTDESDASYNQFLSNAAVRAKELGTTIDGLVNSTADFARLGYGFEDAQGLAEVANIYAVVGDDIDNVETATESLISTLTAFKDEANGLSDSDFAMSIVDKMNEVANNYAISSGGIGDALQRSASSMMAANNSLDETIALITAANTVVQDPDAVGTAFKTISMRIRGAKTELEEAGLETDGMASSTAKLREEILALSGVDIMLNANEFKSTYQIMEELASKWQDLSDIQQASVTELIAGKRQGNIVSSLMTNFDIAQNALETSLNSSGSAMREHEKWSQSLEARLNKLQSAWQSLSQTFLKSDFLKLGIDLITEFVGVLDTLVEHLGTLGTVSLGAGIWRTISQLATVTKGSGGLKSLANIANILPTLTKAFPNAASGIGLFTRSLKEAKYIKVFSSALGYSSAGASLAGAATVAKGAVSGLWAVIAAHPILTAVAAIGIGIVAYNKFTESAEELADRIEEVTANYRDQHESLLKLKGDYDASNEDSMISKYGKLSEGVNALGENVSLTADEYSEYQSIVETIANQMPNLVTGYNSQGDAILSCKGNVEELTEAYKNLIKEQNSEVLDTGADIFKDFKNDLEETTAYYKKVISDDGLNEYAEQYNTDHFEKLKSLITLTGGDKDIESLVNGLSHDEVTRISGLLDEYGIERNVLGSGDAGWETQREHILRALKDDKAEIKNILEEASADLNAYAEDMATVTEAYFSTAFLGGDDSSIGDYSHFSDKMQNIINQITSSFGSEFYDDFLKEDNPYEALTKYFNDMLVAFDKLDDGNKVKLETAFDLQTQFNGGKISYGEYVKGIQEASSIIDSLGLDEEVASQLKLSLNTDEVKKDYDALTKRLVDISTKDLRNLGHFSGASEAMKAATEEAKEFLDSLTASEYAVAIDLIANNEIDLNDFNIDSLREYIEKEARIQEALSFSADIEIDKTALETLNTALEESVSAMGLTSESIDSLKSKYSDLDGYDAGKLFERTANGVKVNREELAKLEKKYNDLSKSDVQEHIDTLTEAYNDNVVAIDDCTNAAERAQLISKNETYKNQIEELATYQAQLEGVTGAYQRWLNAQETPEDYEGYELVATSREDIEDEIDRGFISNASKEYIDLLSGENLQGGTIDDYANAWDKLDDKITGAGHSINDFFTVNDDGDITATGIDRFFKSVQTDFKGSIADFNKETGKWEYNFSKENLQKIQDEWGLGIEAIELLLEAAGAAGYDVDWDGLLDNIDLDTAEFETLVSYAESAQSELNKLKGYEDLKFNFTTTNVADATAEIEKARKAYVDLITNEDGSINLEAEGAEEMRVILSTLLVQKQQLSTPAIMKVDTSQIDQAETDIIDVINKAQALQKAYENYEIAISTGVDVEGAKADLNSAIDGMKGTSVDVRADLKLPTDDELQTAKDSIGDISVGASLDGTAIGNLETKIQTECTPEVIAKVTGLDETAIQNGSQKVVYTADHKDVDDFVNSLSDISKKIIYTYTTEGTKPNPSNINRKITYTYETEGTGPAAGTAHASGSTFGRAFVRGNWGIKGDGTALGGELGQELVVRDGKFFTIGDKGAEFFHYKKNDIIFNAAQTESLFKYGGIKGAKPRGKMLATGTAFVQGNAFATTGVDGGSNGWSNSTTKKKKDTPSSTVQWSATATSGNFAENKSVNSSKSSSGSSSDKSSSSKSSSSKSSSGSSSSKSNDFKETFDWVEVAIDRIERAIDQLDKKANNIYKSWSSRNEALTSEISKVKEEINLQQKAYDKYMSAANAVGLSSSWAAKVRDGAIDISTIKDEALAEKIKDYQSW